MCVWNSPGYRCRIFLALFLFAVLLHGSHASAQTQSEPFVIGALGDSITAAYNLTGPWQAYAYSWSTGHSLVELNYVKSHYIRIRELLKNSQIKAYNEAYHGAGADKIPAQAAQLARYRPHYVTLMIGANDICHYPEKATEYMSIFADNIRYGIRKMIAARPDVKILVVPIVDLAEVHRIVVEQRACRPTLPIAQWFCSVIVSEDTPRATYEAALRGRLEYNAMLEQVTAEFPENAMFVAAAAETKFNTSDLSTFDCFHPSMAGQNKISDVTWGLGWYARGL